MAVSELAFEPLFYADRLHIVNRFGDIGIVTLWSTVSRVEKRLVSLVDSILDPERSRVAVIANLYGDGMYAMLCNLLYNPQIRHILAVGQDLGLPTCNELDAFLTDGLEETVVHGAAMKRIRGTARVLPSGAGFDDALLRSRLTFRYLGTPNGDAFARTFRSYLGSLPPPLPVDGDRVEVAQTNEGDEQYAPSQATAHQVTRRRSLDCWKELVVRVVRFGHRVTIDGGPRLELLNVKAVISEPDDDDEATLASYGFSLEQFREYQRRMLDAVLPAGISYTYGNRLRSYFAQKGGGEDTLATVVEELRANPESRRAYVSLWDTTTDLAPPGPRADSTPCLTSIMFRRHAGRLTLTATYRAHNLLRAWLENVYGLKALLDFVAVRAGMEPGEITVVSHSLGADPRSPQYPVARALADGWSRDDDKDATGRYSLRRDPNGNFVVSVDATAGCIVAEHWADGVLVKQYRSERADRIARQVSADMAVSLPSHALWLGQELAKSEQQLHDATDPAARGSEATVGN